MKKEKFLWIAGVILFFNDSASSAKIYLADKNEQPVAESPKPKPGSLPASPNKIARPKNQTTQLHLDGYIDKNYVRLVVDIEKNNMLSGYMFGKDDARTYVYGQKVNGALHMYDQNGRHFTIILDNK